MTILIVDDDSAQRGLIDEYLTSKGYSCLQAGNAHKAIELLPQQNISMVVMDVRMPGMTGIEALRKIRPNYPFLPVLLITAFADVRDAVSAIKDGALDYLVKPIDFQELLVAVEDAIGHAKGDIGSRSSLDIPDNIIAKSSSMCSLLSELAIVAPSKASILTTGESGTGKEVIANLVHLWSDRKDKALIKVNCAAIPDNLMESELFGHEKGAFTGAIKERNGYFCMADGGTLFLDEIAEMSPNLQAKLLRVIQDGGFQRVGGSQTLYTDVRIVAATNRDLEQAIEEGNFREDLFYRLNVIQLVLPPLRERRADILPLARHFAQAFSDSKIRFSSTTKTALEMYDWPGNIREMRNVIERACLLSRGEIILPEQLPTKISQKSQDKSKSSETGTLIEDVERATILRALDENKGNRTKTAQCLGISRRNLIYKLQKYKEQGYLS